MYHITSKNVAFKTKQYRCKDPPALRLSLAHLLNPNKHCINADMTQALL